MRNLKLQYCKEAVTGVQNANQLLQFQNDETYFIVTQSKIFACRAADETPKEIVELPDIVGVEYISLDNEICIATAGGEVILIDANTKAEHEGTFCDVGIESMTWSPDQEVVVFITKTHNVVVMTCTYDVLAEHALVEEDCDSESQFMNVGWGKKETQFHGTEGKQAAKLKPGFKAPDNINELPQNIEVNWRGDGAYFVVSFVHAAVGRMFKVYDREGKLHYICERVNGLAPSIAWRPSGNWIAVPQLLPNKSTIALFEKNGLRHLEFVLPFDLKEEPIVSLKWSSDSDVLSIQTETAALQRIYLYTIGNYHWYLKQVLEFEKTHDSLVLHQWDNRVGEEKTLHVLLSSGKALYYKWHFAYDRYERSGVVAVIDGKKLLLTNFAKSVIPPPMCSEELKLDSYINACTFLLDDSDQLQLCIYTATRELKFFCAPLKTPTSFEPYITLQADAELTHCQLCNIRYFNGEYLLATHCTANNSRLLLLTIDDGSSDLNYKVQNTLQLKGTVNALTIGTSTLDEFYVQTVNDGCVYQICVKADNTLKLERSYAQLQQPAEHIEWFTLNADFQHGLIALRANECLYLNSQRIADDVTSYCLAGNYLVYTKLKSMHFLRLRDERHVAERKIERGAKLVTTIANDARTVLQMPRGNLEAINPRVLALEIIGALLERKNYLAAMDMLRKQRINLNIICDHNMTQFVASIDLFLSQIVNPNWLCLFISDLQNEDYTKTMYASNYDEGSQKYPDDYKVEHKVEYICKLLCQQMEAKADERFRLPCITAYVKIGQLERALLLTWQQANKSEDLLKYLLYLVDVNELYNVALGTYDFGLVLFVAQKSQKDPKEFLPFLNELKGFELNYRRFKIDEHIKRYEKALQHIAFCGAEQQPEALEFIKQHKLYRQALNCYRSQPDFYQQICIVFADYLRANAKLENASIMYERGGQYQQALLSAKHILDWRRVLALAQKYEQQNLAAVALSMVGPLQEQGRYVEAFELQQKYGEDFAQALQVLLKGRHYLQATFEARMRNGVEDYDDSIIRTDLLNYTNTLEQALNNDQTLFLDYKTRLLAIRQRKALAAINGIDYAAAGEHGNVDESDLLSDTTSMHSSRYTASSRGTGKTFRSSKNRRKHERKLLSLKPGNPFEDIALIDALHNLITKLVQQQQHIRDTCKALLELQHDVEASRVQSVFKQLLKLVQDSLNDIWIPELSAGGNGTLEHLTGPNIDYTQLQNEQRYALIEPLKRFKPQLNLIDWEHDILC